MSGGPIRTLDVYIELTGQVERPRGQQHFFGSVAVIAANNVPVGQLIADRAYYSIERGETLSQAGITPVIPPPSNAVVHGGSIRAGTIRLLDTSRTGAFMHSRRNMASACTYSLRRRSRASKAASMSVC